MESQPAARELAEAFDQAIKLYLAMRAHARDVAEHGALTMDEVQQERSEVDLKELNDKVP